MNVLAYLGPETMLPMTSVLAGVLGFIMMFGRKVFDFTVGLFRKQPVSVAPKTRARGQRPSTSRPVDSMSPRAGAESSEVSDRVA